MVFELRFEKSESARDSWFSKTASARALKSYRGKGARSITKCLRVTKAKAGRERAEQAQVVLRTRSAPGQMGSGDQTTQH